MYVVVPIVEVLIVEGFHVPLILLFDVVERVGGVDPWQSGPICVNVGETWFEITISIVVTAPH